MKNARPAVEWPGNLPVMRPAVEAAARRRFFLSFRLRQKLQIFLQHLFYVVIKIIEHSAVRRNLPVRRLYLLHLSKASFSGVMNQSAFP